MLFLPGQCSWWPYSPDNPLAEDSVILIPRQLEGCNILCTSLLYLLFLLLKQWKKATDMCLKHIYLQQGRRVNRQQPDRRFKKGEVSKNQAKELPHCN